MLEFCLFGRSTGMTTENPISAHQKHVAKKCVEDAQKVLGAGWGHVSYEIRWGLVCSYILSVLLSQDEDVPAERVRVMMTNITAHAEELMQ